MNMQAIMKQAQKMQQDMLKKKEEIDKTIFEGESSLVKVKVNGKKEILEVNIDKNNKLDSDDIEMLEDMIVLAVNDALKKVEKETENKMGNIAPGLSSLM